MTRTHGPDREPESTLESEAASLLAEWLDEPSAAPPGGLSPEVREALYVLRPDLSPPPSLMAEQILNEIRSGPLAVVAPARASAFTSVVERFRASSWSWSGLGLALAAAVALLIVLPQHVETPISITSSAPPASEASALQASPSPAQAMEKHAGSGRGGGASTMDASLSPVSAWVTTETPTTSKGNPRQPEDKFGAGRSDTFSREVHPAPAPAQPVFASPSPSDDALWSTPVRSAADGPGREETSTHANESVQGDEKARSMKWGRASRGAAHEKATSADPARAAQEASPASTPLARPAKEAEGDGLTGGALPPLPPSVLSKADLADHRLRARNLAEEGRTREAIQAIRPLLSCTHPEVVQEAALMTAGWYIALGDRVSARAMVVVGLEASSADSALRRRLLELQRALEP